MNQEQMRNFIIGIVALGVILGGSFYYQKKNKEKIAQENAEEVATTTESLPTPEPMLTEEEIAKKKADDANAAELKLQEAEKRTRWNTAMENARTAFGKGEYDKSIVFYNQALSYIKNDKVYSGLFLVYSAQNNVDKARVAIDTAIKLNPTYTEYWIWKIVLLDEKTNVSFADLKLIYQEALTKTDPRSKINLVTAFAVTAEQNGEKTEAIALWEYAKEINPVKTDIYQAEINRLSAVQ